MQSAKKTKNLWFINLTVYTVISGILNPFFFTKYALSLIKILLVKDTQRKHAKTSINLSLYIHSST